MAGLVGMMDQLWFQQIIFSPKTFRPSSFITDSISEAAEDEEPLLSNAHSSDSHVISEENSSMISFVQDEYNNQSKSSDEEEDSDGKNDERQGERTLNRSGSGNVCACRHSSSSPSGARKQRSDMYSVSLRRLSKTMSCKSLCELELEEVKGFMDLGFTFDKQHLNKKMMSVLPGLQRLDLGDPELRNSHETEEDEEVQNEEHEDEGNKRVIIRRPYLSEAWLIKRPDSPLLNLRVPRVSTADDMKKHLKYWAKTVASAIQLES